MTTLIDTEKYIHFYYADFAFKHQDAVSIINSTKTDMLKKYIRTNLDKQVSERVAAAFGLSELPQDLKEELFLSENSLQSRLQQHVHSSSTALIRAFQSDSSTIQGLMGAYTKEQRDEMVDRIFDESTEQASQIITQANQMLDYYMDVMKYQESAALALAANGDERAVIQSFLSAHNLEAINMSSLNKNIQEAIIQYHNVRKLNSSLKALGDAGNKVEIIKSLDGLAAVYHKFGWQIKEIADAHALNLALTEGDKSQEDVIKAFQSGKVTGTLAGSDLLMGVTTNIKIDPRLEAALKDTDNRGYTRQIKADSFGIYTSSSGVSGIIELSSKNRASYKGGTEKTLPVAIQNTTLEKAMRIAGKQLSYFNDFHLSYNLIAAREGPGFIPGAERYDEGTLSNLWENYKTSAMQLSFLDYLSGQEFRNTFGNNAMFFIVNERVLSLYDLIEGVTNNPEIIKNYIKGKTALLNRQSKHNITTAKTPQERSEKALGYAEKILKKEFTIKINIATLAALAK